MKVNKKDKLILSESTKIKQRKKNGIWYNIMSSFISFFSSRKNTEEIQDSSSVTVKPNNGNLKRNLVRGGLAAGDAGRCLCRGTGTRK